MSETCDSKRPAHDRDRYWAGKAAEPAALTACLDELGVDHIQLLVLTHDHLDHVGGIDAVLGRVDRVLVGPASDPHNPAIGGALVTVVMAGFPYAERGRVA